MRLRQLTSRFGLPLLAKELIEQAARKRTYVIRVVYACLLFATSLLLFHDVLRMNAGSPFATLGHGRRIFELVMILQFAGVYLFMPAITCAVLSQEKERNSLTLLFLTRLGPWTIVLEKLLGRLVPMLTFLLLSLPLLAFAYVLGGVAADSLWTGVWMLALAAFWTGSLAVCCSAWFRTTVGAFVGTYLIGIALLFGPAVGDELFYSVTRADPPGWQLLHDMGIYETREQMGVLFFAPPQYFVGARTIVAPLIIALRSVPILSSGLFFLVLARIFLIPRAFVSPRNLLLQLFAWTDRTFARLNENRLTRGIVLMKEGSSLPDVDPVAWRETTKRSLGRPRYLLRIFLALECPVAAMLLAIASIGGHLGGLTALMFLLWIVAALIVSVQSASLIAGERTHQTLDVLATIPVSGREILLQKLRGVQRLILVLAVPFASVMLFKACWIGAITDYRQGGWDVQNHDWLLYSTCALLSIAVYLPLVAWLSVLIGLVARTQARAIVSAVAVIAGWCILPLVFIVLPLVLLLDLSGGGPAPPSSFLLLLSPATIIAINEYHELNKFAHAPWLAVAFNFACYGLALRVLRGICLANADRFLGRVESRPAIAVRPASARPIGVSLSERTTA